MSTNQIAKTQSGLSNVKKWIESDAFKEQIARSLPTHMTADRFTRIALTAMMRTPKLMQCTQESVLNCLMALSQYGLEPDGRRAHLIPYKTTCTLVLDYKGISELVHRSGLVSTVQCDVVCDKDVFRSSKGYVIDHEVDYRKDIKERGDAYAAYCIVKLKDGTEKCEIMAKHEIMAIRDRSSGWRAFKAGVADQSTWDPKEPVIEREMWKKTVFKRASKWLPWSPEIRDAIEREEDDDERLKRIIESTAVKHIEGSKSDALAKALQDRLTHAESDAEPADEPPGDGDPSEDLAEQVEPSRIQELRDWLESQMVETSSCNEDASVVKCELNGRTIYITSVPDFQPPSNQPEAFVVSADDEGTLDVLKDAVYKARKAAK